jgi:hypothetical protein
VKGNTSLPHQRLLYLISPNDDVGGGRKKGIIPMIAMQTSFGVGMAIFDDSTEDWEDGDSRIV